jgi:hypothetical protein
MSNNVSVEINLKDGISKELDKIGDNVKSLEKELDKTGQTMQESFTKGTLATNNLSGGVKGLVSNFISVKGAIVAVAGAMAVKLVSSAIKASAEFETIKFQLQGVVGGAEKAQERMEELADFASATPFQLAGIAKASKLLQTFGGDALATGDSLRLVGDASAFAGVEMEDLALHVGRAYDGLRSGTAIGESLARFQQLGLVSGEARREIEELQKAGQNLEAWRVLEDALGKTSGTMKGLSDTAGGLYSTIKDELNLALVDLGNVFMEDVKDGLRVGISLIKEISPLVTGLAKGVKMVVDGYKELTLIPTFDRINKITGSRELEESYNKVIELSKKHKEGITLTGREALERGRAITKFLTLQQKLDPANQLSNYQLSLLGFWRETDKQFTTLKPEVKKAGEEQGKALEEGFQQGRKVVKNSGGDANKLKERQKEAEIHLDQIWAKEGEKAIKERIALEIGRDIIEQKLHQENLKRLEQEELLKQKQAEAEQKRKDDELATLQRNQRVAIEGMGQLSRVLSDVFAKNKQLALSDAIIQGALAMQRAWASAPWPFNAPALTATGIATTANVARINAQKFEMGGPVMGRRHSSGGVPAELEGGEFVLSRKDVANMGGMAGVQAMRTQNNQKFAFNNTFNVSVGGSSSPQNIVEALKKEVGGFARFFREEVVGANYNVGLR